MAMFMPIFNKKIHVVCDDPLCWLEQKLERTLTSMIIKEKILEIDEIKFLMHLNIFISNVI